MQYFNNLKSPALLTESNSLKMQGEYAFPIVLEGNVYNREAIIKLEKTVDQLAKLTLVFELFIEPETGNFRSDYLVCKLLRQILFETAGTGFNLMDIRPEYTIQQIESFIGKPLFSYILADVGINNINFALTGYVKVRLPLFLFFSVNPNDPSPISVRTLETLQLRLITNSQEEMSMVIESDSSLVTINKMIISLEQQSYNKQLSKLDQFLNYEKINGQKFLKNSYNIFYEEPVVLKAGTTSHSIILRCNEALSLLSAVIGRGNNRVAIKTYSIHTRSEYIVQPTSLSTNYSFYNPDQNLSENAYLNYWFNKKNNLYSNTGLITFSSEDGMYPTYLTVTYEAQAEDVDLKAFCFYLTKHKVDSRGIISPSDYGSYLLALNAEGLNDAIIE